MVFICWEYGPTFKGIQCTCKLWAWKLLIAKTAEDFAIELDALTRSLDSPHAFNWKACDEELFNSTARRRFLWLARTKQGAPTIEVPCCSASIDVVLD
jgi:hypothetical protein